jgi:hypothetical protein
MRRKNLTPSCLTCFQSYAFSHQINKAMVCLVTSNTRKFSKVFIMMIEKTSAIMPTIHVCSQSGNCYWKVEKL